MLKRLSIFMIFLLSLNFLLPLKNAFAFDLLTPANLTANQYYPGNIVLSWDKVTGASGYRIYQVDGGQQKLLKEVSYTDLTATIYGVQEGTFSYAVTAYRSTTETALSNTVTVTVTYPEMQSPANGKYSVTNGNDVTLSWDKVTYATDYNIYQIADGTKKLVATAQTNSYTFVNHTEGNFTYEITSYNSRFGESASGASIPVNVVFPVMQSPVVSYTIQNGNDLVFTWNRVNYATNYKVYEVTDGQRNLLTTTRLNSHLITNVSEGHHVYEVSSFSDRFGESTAYQLQIDVVYPIMQAPGSFTYTLTNQNDINLRWTQAEYATAYKLYQIINGERKLVTTTKTQNVTFKNMPEGTYTYEIASYSDRFGESPAVASLQFDVVFPEMIAPQNLNLTVQNGNDLILRWDAFEFATAYNVYQIINGERKLVTTKYGNAASFYNMPEGHYTYQVTSYSDRFGESPSSQIDYDLKFPTLQAPVLTGSVANQNTVVLDWIKTDNSTGYNIYEVVNGVKKYIGTTSSLQFKINRTEGVYLYEVTSYNTRFGESPASNQVKLWIGPTLEAPKTSEPKVEDNNVTLSWSPVSNAASYNIYEVVNGELKLVENTTGTDITINNLQPGNYEYEIFPVTATGIEGDAYSTVTVQQAQFDTTPPVTVSNIQDNYLNQDFTVQLSATDDQSGVAKTYYSIDGGAYNEGTSFTLSNEGNYQISYYSVDNAGNIEKATTKELIIDKTAPVTTSNATDAWINKDGDIQLTATDNLSGVDKTYYSINGSNFIEGTNFTLENEGLYEISFYSVDRAGNTEEVKTAVVKIDKTAPATTSNLADTWYGKFAAVQLTATDNLSGVAKTYYSVDGGEFKEGTDFILNEEGIHQVSYYSIDNAGNIEVEKTETVKIDTEAPVTSSDIENPWYMDDVKVNLKATDNLSGVLKTFYSINGSDFAEGNQFTVSPEGINTIEYYSVDQAGNVEEMKTEQVMIDKTAPTVSVNMQDQYALGSSVILDYNAADNLSGVAKEEVTFNGVTYKRGDTISFDKPGIYTLSIKVTDQAGWTTNVEKSITVYIPATIEILPKVMKGNKGTFTVKVTLPSGFSSEQFDLSSVTLNGVHANGDKNGLLQQAKNGQFKFNRQDFQWTPGEETLEFKAYLGGQLVLGNATVKVLP